MSVLNPRTRLVNFRLSEIEYNNLKEACYKHGARSVSEFARTSVLGAMEQPAAMPAPTDSRIETLDQKTNELEIRIEQLLRLLALASAGRIDRKVNSHPLSIGNEIQQSQ